MADIARVEDIIALAVVAELKPSIDAVVTNQAAVAKSQQEVVAALNNLAAAIRGATPTPVPTPPPGPPAPEPPPPGPPPVVIPDSPIGAKAEGEGSTLRWHSVVWTLTRGVILRDGKSTPDVARTAGVLWMQIVAQPSAPGGTMLIHMNAERKIYAHTGAPDWALLQNVMLDGSGTLIAGGPAPV